MKTTMKNGIRQAMKRSAEISTCGQFRWWLQRRWADGPLVCFVMLNPSVADAEQDDPTIRRCIAFARAWGFGALSVRNLFPYLATKPADLKRAMKSIDVTGGQRGLGELAVAATADLVIAAWGANATECAAQRFYAVTASKPLWCIDTTLEGKPVHPLYQAADKQPKAFLRCDGKVWTDALDHEEKILRSAAAADV